LQDFEQVGGIAVDDMEQGNVILGIKEIPKEKLLKNKTYLFFSHTIKGQSGNMPMLKRIMEGMSTLIDYERIVDDKKRRLVYFGRYAGDAGAIDILWLMSEYWENKGISTPLKGWKQATHFHSVEDARQQLRIIGEKIKKSGFPDPLSPMVIGILGYGNVSKGAQNIFDCLPVERISPGDLKKLEKRNEAGRHKVYLTVFEEEDMVRRKDGGTFNLQDYYTNPDIYESQFAQYLPHLTILVNATYWDNRYPRFVTWADLEELYRKTQTPKLQGIADITCDVDGSIECNVKITDTGMPAYQCDPITKTTRDGHLGEGIVLLAVDNLPAEIPNDSSAFFSNQLRRFIPEIIRADLDKDLKRSGLPVEIQRAVIVYKGELTPDYRYLETHLYG
jgi:alpha-aminoadipic semialdehyde synthase